jgi:hypothetical protein
MAAILDFGGHIGFLNISTALKYKREKLTRNLRALPLECSPEIRSF